jgi:hypothetical protein
MPNLGPVQRGGPNDLFVRGVDDVLSAVVSGPGADVIPTVTIIADMDVVPGQPARRVRLHFPAEMVVWLLGVLPDITEQSIRKAQRGREGLDP